MSVKKLAKLLNMKDTNADDVAEEAIDTIEEQEREIKALQAQLRKNSPEDVVERGTLTAMAKRPR